MPDRSYLHVVLIMAAGASLTATPSAASEWWHTGALEEEHVFIDRESIQTVSVYGKRVLAAWEQTLDRAKPGGAIKDKTLFLYNCSERTRAMRAYFGYDVRGQVTNSYDWSDHELKFQVMPPDSHGEEQINFVCNYQRGAGETTKFEVGEDTYYYIRDPVQFVVLFEAALKSPPAVQTPKNDPRVPTLSDQSAGTAFFINAEGVALTSAHVVESCSEIRSGRYGLLTVIAVDEASDLALLRSSARNTAYAPLRQVGPKLAESVNAAGYPLTDLLGKGLRVTSGTVSGLSGIGGNRTYFQISAPIQPGNSGGPVIDQSRQVIGVVAGKLDDAVVAEQTGGLPQNVNFAVSGPIIQSFLDENGVRSPAPLGVPPLPADYTFHVRCLG